MLGNSFRPWGLLNWILHRTPAVSWNLLGCLAPEERCLAVVSDIHDKLSNVRLVKVVDPPSRFSSKAESLSNANKDKFLSLGYTEDNIEQYDLLERYGNYISKFDDFIDASNGNIIIDISSFPKRFFFPYVRRCLESDNVSNLLVTYTIPERYCDELLAENYDDTLPLPLFSEMEPFSTSPDFAFIGIGFLTLRLTELLRDYSGTSLKFLFPFPPGPPHYQRNLQFLNEIVQTLGTPAQKVIRVNAYDTSDTFDYICRDTNHGEKKAILAPFGPKPISLAMCIYATITNSAVYYSQPRVYNPEYTIGVKYVDECPLIYAYCLRIGDKNFYSVKHS